MPGRSCTSTITRRTSGLRPRWGWTRSSSAVLGTWQPSSEIVVFWTSWASDLGAQCPGVDGAQHPGYAPPGTQVRLSDPAPQTAAFIPSPGPTAADVPPVNRTTHIGAPSAAATSEQPVRPTLTKRTDRAMASMAVNELGPMLTASEVAELLHLHVNTVKRLGDRGELPFYRVCKRGDRRFRMEDVVQFLAKTR